MVERTEVSTHGDRASLVASKLIDRLARVDLRVRDLERSLSFYRDVVGLRTLERGGTSASLGSSSGPAFLTLDAEGVTSESDPSSTGLFHLAIRFPTRADLGNALARLAKAGYEIGAGDHVVSEALYVDDPDGNGVELYWDRPVERWPAPTGDAVIPMATLPLDLQGVLEAGRGTEAAGHSAPQGTDMGHVHLQVSDIETTTRFYVAEVGLDLIAKLGGSAGFFSSNGYHHHIGANSWRSRGGEPAPRDRAGLSRVVFSVSAGKELEALRLRLQEYGRESLGDDRGAVVVRDPDGIELFFATTD